MSPAQTSLRGYENAAASGASEQILYTGTGTQRKKKKSKLKVIAPLAIVLTILIGGGALILSSMSLLPIHLDSLITEATDVQFADNSLVKKMLTKFLLSSGSLPSSFAERLGKAGITVGYLNKEGNFIAGLHDNSTVNLASTNAPADNSLVLQFENQLITPADLIDSLDSNLKLRSAFSEATYGRAMNFYDESAENFYSGLNITRNVFKDFEVSGDEETDRESYNSTMSEIFEKKSNSSANTVVDATDEVYASDPYNNPKSPCYHNFQCSCQKYAAGREWFILNGICYCEKEANNAATGNAVEEYINAVKNRATATSSSEATYNTAALLSNAVGANETYQSMQFFLANEENISKMKAGEGNNSAINQVLNWLTTPTTTTTINTEGEEITLKGAPIEADALAAILAGEKFTNEKSADFSSERILNIADNKLNGTTGAHTTQSAISAISNTLMSVKITLQSFISDFTSLFIGKIQSATAFAAESIIALITPSLSKSVLFSNAADYSGIVAGNFYVKGASAANSYLARSAQGGTVGDANAVTAYNRVTANVLALDAAADRATRSPFDVNSKNTFLGSIVTSLLPIATSSPLHFFSSLLSLTNNSLPSAFALGEDSSYQTTYGECSALTGINAKGDVYCNSIITFDTSTIDNALNDSGFQSFVNNNTNADGTPKENSDLAKFILYNNGRESPIGVKDANILNALNKNTESEKKWYQKITSFFKNLFSSLFSTSGTNNYEKELKEQNQIGFATGSVFVNSSSNAYWNTFKYAQRYVSISRALEQLGYFDEDNTNTAELTMFKHTNYNPVNKFTNDYFAAHPVDNSDSGYLARISGITKEDAEFVIAYINYVNYLANYDYNNLYSFIEKQPQKETAILLGQDIIDEYYLKPALVIYNDIRNRSYAV
ncbi:hypothetical protein IJK16_03450 [Candidatus Saccharibacteria bacterium]|nr:hypothetical protein [Candidatus Saccharibacteria bacterium]